VWVVEGLELRNATRHRTRRQAGAEIMAIKITIKGHIVRGDRKERRRGDDRRMPVLIHWPNRDPEPAYGATINGLLRVLCLPRKQPFMLVEGGEDAIIAGDPVPRREEPRGYAHIYVCQTERRKNLKSSDGVEAIIARWNSVSRYSSEVMILGTSEIAYGASDGLRDNVGLWVQTWEKPRSPRGAWKYHWRRGGVVPAEDAERLARWA
jgi:hypothetical protein